MMNSQTRAVIDIGSNSVKLLVADVWDRRVTPLLEKSDQTRLGRGSYQSHRLTPPAIAETTKAVARFLQLAASFGTTSCQILATSAAREAENRGELEAAIHAATGQKVRILTGDEEAVMTFTGATLGLSLDKSECWIMDVGGGSTEVIFGLNHQMKVHRSYPLGTVRLLESKQPSDPPTPEELAEVRSELDAFFHRHIQPDFSSCRPRWDNLHRIMIGTGGTSSILARMHRRLDRFDRKAIDDARLEFDDLKSLVNRLWSTALAKRQRFVGLPPNRADVILIGAAIYEAAFRVLNIEALRPSSRGLRFAAVLEDSPSL